MEKFFTSFAVVFVAEMGDKTQLFLIGLTSKFKLRSIIIGVIAAVIMLNGAAAAAGYFIGGAIDPSIIKVAAGVAFLGFAYTTLLPEKEEGGRLRGRGAALAVFLSFSLAELGDKTQLTALTLSADSAASGGGLPDAVTIFIACTAGLLAADAVGIAAGHFLSKHLPEKVLPFLSFSIFTFFGIYTLAEATSALTAGTLPTVIVTASVTLAFAALCALTLIFQRKKKKEGSCE